VRVNALGDRDSQQRFSRELSLHLRKHLDRIEEPSRRSVLENPFSIYRINTDAVREILEGGPRPMHFLSEKSRVHFRSVLEHLEHLGLPYELDDLLAGDERGLHIAFALDFDGSDTTIQAAIGGRFDEYLKRETHRKDSVGVGASIYFRKKGTTRSTFTSPPAMPKPKIYFAQLGLRAKLQGLTVVDMLRIAHIPVLQSFDANHLSIQLASAAQLGVPFLLIMGQREALDGTIIVRSTRNSSQNIISVNEIPKFLRTLR
jgi:histidyl-tRNA synthetase